MAFLTLGFPLTALVVVAAFITLCALEGYWGTKKSDY